MEPGDIFTLASAIIASLGGGAALVLAFSSWLGKVWASRIMEKDKARYEKELEDLKSRYLRDTEKYKTSLKKSEFIFEKEYKAACEFMALKISILPKWNNPEIDWEEALNEIAMSFAYHETPLYRFLGEHGAVLSKKNRERLRGCISLAESGKFDIVPPDIISDNKVLDSAEIFFNNLVKIEEELLEIVRDQSRVGNLRK